MMSGAAGTERAPRAGSLRLAICGVLAAVCVLLMSGCGQKGPLYLPQRTGSVVTRPAQGEEAAPGEQSSESSSSSSSSTASASSSTIDSKGTVYIDSELPSRHSGRVLSYSARHADSLMRSMPRMEGCRARRAKHSGRSCMRVRA